MQINNNNYSVSEIRDMFARRDLIINREYQRGAALWPTGPRGYFIDTILSGYPFPKIYFYEYIDSASSRTRRELVDGQQRVTSILDFLDDKFPVTGDSQYSGQRYSQLPQDTQIEFLSYSVPVDVIRSASQSEILQMFRRMNAYTLPLNEAERRHSSFQGEFKWFINNTVDELSSFFVEFGVFTNRQIVRMADAELISDTILAFEVGNISTSSKDLKDLYGRYDSAFPLQEDYRARVHGAFRFIIEELPALRKTYMMKPYALHSLLVALIHLRHGIPAIEEEFQIRSIRSYSMDPHASQEALLTLARAHEVKDMDGLYKDYVWGCLAGTNRSNRRASRLKAVMRALLRPDFIG